MQTAVRCYRYALRPTLEQARAIEHAQAQARRLWNEMVALLKWAEKEQRNGRREALLHEYGRILQGKSIAGVALTQARKLVVEGKFLNVEEACAAGRSGRVDTARQWGRRRLSQAYAVERTLFNAKGKHFILFASTVVAITRKFADASALYVIGKRGGLHFKTKAKSVCLERQVDPRKAAPVDFEHGTVDLAAVLGSESCRSLRAILHRPLPVGARIKQVCVTSTGTRSFVTFVVEAPISSFVRHAPEASAVAGIDPGRKTALTVSDTTGETQFSIQPPLFRDKRFLRRHNRLQRKADRQLRAANPERFDEKGQWKQVRGPLVITRGLQDTRTRIADGLRHIADARREAYHLGANRLLKEFGTVGVGNWRGRGKAPGVGKSKRAQNRKDYDNAISEFTAILKDKAARCSQPRTVLDIRENGTTKNCPDCGNPTGPSGLKDLKVRVWTCTACGVTHQRDFASARAIARRTREQITAAGAHPAQPEPAKARTPAVPLTKVRPAKGAKSPLARNEASEHERRSVESAGKPVGVEVAPKPAPCSQPTNHRQMELPLANSDAPRPYAIQLLYARLQRRAGEHRRATRKV